MGPIPGLSWADVVGIVASVVMAMFVYGGQWFQADVLSVAGGDRTTWRVVLLALAVPFVLSTLNHAWLIPPEPVRVGALVVWLGGTILVRLGTASHIGGLGAAVEPSWQADGPTPNVLRQAGEPNVITATPGTASDRDAVTMPSPGGRRWASGLLTVVLLGGATTAPGAVSGVLTQTACERVDSLLASAQTEERQADPKA